MLGFGVVLGPVVDARELGDDEFAIFESLELGVEVELLPLFRPDFHVFLDPLVLEEEPLVTSAARIELALEHDVSDFDALGFFKLRRSGPSVHLNEGLLFSGLNEGVKVLLHPVVPGLVAIVGELVARAFVLQLVGNPEFRAHFSVMSHLRVQVVGRIVEGGEYD